MKDWVEDFHHENGQYQCHCIQCKELFIGYKRRAVCKECIVYTQYRREYQSYMAEAIREGRKFSLI